MWRSSCFAAALLLVVVLTDLVQYCDAQCDSFSGALCRTNIDSSFFRLEDTKAYFVVSSASHSLIEVPPDDSMHFQSSWNVILNLTDADENIDDILVDMRGVIGRVDDSDDALDYNKKWELPNGFVIIMWRCKAEAMESLWGIHLTHQRLHYVGCIEAVPKVASRGSRLESMSEGWLQSEVYWHLDRVDQKDQPYDGAYTFSRASKGGEGVSVYIVDTGIRAGVSGFGGRATFAYSSVEGEIEDDCNGHGTHVAGIVGSSTFGFAKKSHLYAVKALDCDGYSYDTSVLEGLYWILRNAQKPAIVSLSLGGEAPSRSLFRKTQRVDALGLMTEALLSEGIAVIIAAGNENRDACHVTPAYKSETTAAISVGASDHDDKRAYFSNFGPCTSLFAPGADIMSTWMDGKAMRLSGTSMATPAVTGIAALHLGEDPTLTPSELKRRILQDAVRGQITDIRGDTVNLLLHSRYSFEPPDDYAVPVNWLRQRGDIFKGEASSSTLSVGFCQLAVAVLVFVLYKL